MHWLLKKQTWRWTMLVVTPLVVLYFLWLVRPVLLPFLLAILLAYLLAPLVNLMEARGFRRLWAILLVYLGLIGISSLLVGFGYPRLITELMGLNENIPVYTQKVQEVLHSFEANYSGLPQSVRKVIDQRVAGIEVLAIAVIQRTVDILLGLVSEFMSFILAPILAIYILKDKDLLIHNFQGLIPRKIKVDVMDLVHDVDEIVRNFIRGHLLVCSLVGSLTTLALYLIGMPYALLLGIFAGIADLIPFFGPLIGAVPAVAIAIVQSWRLTLIVVLSYFVIQQVESNIISPKIMGDALGLHPLIIIFALLAGGQLGGIIGMLVSLPIAAIIRVVGRYIFLKLVA